MDWFTVTIADEIVHLHVAPPGRDEWTAAFPVSDIVRVAFEAGSMLTSDTLYVFIRGREPSYAIPTEAVGGAAFFGALIDRHLFDAKLAIEAATADEGAMFLWPPL